MKFKKNKRYRLFNYEPRCGMLYSEIKDNLIYFYNSHDNNGEIGKTRWVEQGFVDYKLIFRSNMGFNRDFCYLLLKENDGKACVMEMVSKKIILKDINYKKCKIILRSIWNSERDFCYILFEKSDKEAFIMEIFNKNIILRNFNYKDIYILSYRLKDPFSWNTNNFQQAHNVVDKKDAILVIWNKKQKQYSIFSIENGYIFGPKKYNKIKICYSGVILDEHLAVENTGYIFDFAGYEIDGWVYYNKEKNDYRLFYDNQNGKEMFQKMTTMVNNDDVVEAWIENDEYNDAIKYIYNKKTGEFNKEDIPNEDYYYFDEKGYERDTWWALTDGQYGDYPENEIDRDELYDALGF